MSAFDIFHQPTATSKTNQSLDWLPIRFLWQAVVVVAIVALTGFSPQSADGWIEGNASALVGVSACGAQLDPFPFRQLLFLSAFQTRKTKELIANAPKSLLSKGFRKRNHTELFVKRFTWLCIQKLTCFAFQVSCLHGR